MRKHREERHEEGQSLIIIGALLVVLVALIGLVVDAGNAYAQRRILQNALDASVMAGAQELGRQDDWLLDPSDTSKYLYNWQVIAAVEDFAARNRVAANELAIYYADIEGNVLADAREMDSGLTIREDTFGVRAEAIIVEGARPFPTYLVRVLGRNDLTAHANAMGILACGACSVGKGGEGLFPIAFHVKMFDEHGGFPQYGKSVQIWAADPHSPGTGSFGYLSWYNDPSNTELEYNMAHTENAPPMKVGFKIPTGPGVQVSNAIEQELTYRINNSLDLNRPATVTVPIYGSPVYGEEVTPTGYISETEGTGNNLTYEVTGFAAFRIECYHFSKNHAHSGVDENDKEFCTFDKDDNSKWIQGRFVPKTLAGTTAGCSNYGICSATTTTGLKVERVLAGRVTPWQITPQQNATAGASPVDVVHVVDVSGSMCANWDGSGGGSPCTDQGRLAVAKDVLQGFNTCLGDPVQCAEELDLDWENPNWDPNGTSRVGLVSYPSSQSSYTYDTDCGIALGRKCTDDPNYDCGKSLGTVYFADKKRVLGESIGSVNGAISSLTAQGGTSMPRGLQYGRELVTEYDGDRPTNNSGNQQVLILTTDGMANIKIDGEWSGYLGNYPNPPLIEESGCNDSVYQAAIEQANDAKQKGVIVFTIGIHETIDEDLMTAIATADTHPDKPHFFQAQTAEDFSAIYDSILDRLPKLGSEECTARENAVVGKNAWVYLYDDKGNQVASTKASSTGDYIFEGIEPGEYELRASWTDHPSNILYDVMTWTLGGDPADQPITVEVPLGKQTTQMNLYLRTDHEFVCGE